MPITSCRSDLRWCSGRRRGTRKGGDCLTHLLFAKPDSESYPARGGEGRSTAKLHSKLNCTMSTLTSFLGFSAAALTTIANLPQVLKCWRTGNTDDLSPRMLLALSGGTALWTLYGVSQKDTAIVIGNSISFALAALHLPLNLGPLLHKLLRWSAAKALLPIQV